MIYSDIMVVIMLGHNGDIFGYIYIYNGDILGYNGDITGYNGRYWDMGCASQSWG